MDEDKSYVDSNLESRQEHVSGGQYIMYHLVNQTPFTQKEHIFPRARARQGKSVWFTMYQLPM